MLESMPRLLKPKEIAEFLNVSVPQVYKLLNEGEIRCVRIKKSVRVKPEDLNEYINGCMSAQ
jgi:excisionase family DNA binding protein